MENDLRVILRINEDGTKTQVRMAELKPGDAFEVYEFMDKFYATSHPFQDENNIWSINIETEVKV